MAGDIDKEIKVDLKFIISAEEAASLSAQIGQFALGIVRSRFGRSDELGQFAMTQFLSGEEGRKELASATAEAEKYVGKLQTVKALELKLTIQPKTDSITGADQFGQLAVAILEQLQPVSKSMFNFFPADRAFPNGEVPIQLGSHDAGAQLQSYMAAPSSKYQRLKQTLAQGLIMNTISPQWIKDEFNSVLEALLPGKQFHGVSVNQIGQLKILIRDEISGKMFDIDSMSSGEKGVILTFLLGRVVI